MKCIIKSVRLELWYGFTSEVNTIFLYAQNLLISVLEYFNLGIIKISGYLRYTGRKIEIIKWLAQSTGIKINYYWLLYFDNLS